MNTYIALYKNKRIEVHALTTYEAQLKAAKEFNAQKVLDVTIFLCEKDGKPVIHNGF